MNNGNIKHGQCDNPSCECGNDEVSTISVSLDDGTEVECNILGIFEVKGNEYIALLPFEDEEVLLYSYQEIGNEVELNEIEDDDLYDEVSDMFYSMINDEEEYFGDDDEEEDDDDDDGYEYDDDDEDDDDGYDEDYEDDDDI